MELNMIPQYWFHITGQKWGNQITLYPRIPQTLSTDEEGRPLEPLTPRICVAPTISGCLSAINAGNYDDPMIVYHTAEKIPASPADVPDGKITKEHWILTPCKFVKFTVLRGGFLNMLPAGPTGDDTPSALKKQQIRKNKIREHLLLAGIDPAIA